jgi:hypothetical protein
MSPEAKARQLIDQKLVASGWTLQDYKGEFNPSASLCIIRGYLDFSPLTTVSAWAILRIL